MTITRSIGALATIILLSGAVTSCAETPSSSASQQAETDTTPHEMHGPPGPAMLLFAALHHLDLSAEQRATIEGAAHSVAADMPVDHGVFTAVAAGVRAGKVDEARVLAMLGASGPAADRTASPASALATLHATLRPEQRRALVDLLGTHIDEHESAMATGSPGPGGKLEHVLSRLNLTSDQRVSIDRIVAAQPADEHSAAMHAGLRARLESFATDQFDAAAFAAPFPATTMGMRDHIERTLHMLAAILPVLDQTQREALAAVIEAGPRPH